MRHKTLPLFLWLIVPILIILGQVGIELSFDDREFLARLHSEGGPQETLQEIIMLAAVLVSAWMLIRHPWRTRKPEGLLIALVALGSIYILGEEISWGQHKLGWSTPEFWGTLNDQNETNIHNTSSWFDQKPRLLLFIGIVVGGLVVPALRRWKPSALPVKFQIYYPSNLLIPTALGVLVPYTAQEIAEHVFGTKIFTRVSEVQEVYIYYFILLYLLDFRLRLTRLLTPLSAP